MTNELKQPEDNPIRDTELVVAYLDGELDADSSRDFERRLSEDAHLRKRLREHQRTWDLLEEIPSTEVDEKFVRTTVEMVALSAAADVRHLERLAARSRLWKRLLVGFALMATAALGYFVVSAVLSTPDRQLVRDLPIVENLDAYRNAESVEFLRALQREGLFTPEVADDL